VFIALTCQDDLDMVIQLTTGSGSSCSEFSVRLFRESSAGGVFIKTPSPDVQPPVTMVCFLAMLLLGIVLL